MNHFLDVSVSFQHHPCAALCVPRFALKRRGAAGWSQHQASLGRAVATLAIWKVVETWNVGNVNPGLIDPKVFIMWMGKKKHLTKLPNFSTPKGGMIFCRPCKVVPPKTLAKLVPITQLGFVVGIPYYRTQLRLQYDASETYQLRALLVHLLENAGWKTANSSWITAKTRWWKPSTWLAFEF